MDEEIKNFGDYITEFLVRELFFPPVRDESKPHNIHIVGSVLDDMFVPSSADPGITVTFWGCGLRNASGISKSNRDKVEILSVRGPLTASELKLGDEVPIGDPGFLLPALYKPRKAEKFSGRTVCVPHFYESRPDREIRQASGCDLVVRTDIKGDIEAFTSIVDAICAADFVLSSSLHGAIVAAAYGRPFAFWDAGVTDVPFKWEDFAGSIDIPCVFAENLESARKIYAETISGTVKIPAMWPSLIRPPLILRSSGLLSVIDHELSTMSGEAAATFLRDALPALKARAAAQDQTLERGLLGRDETTGRRIELASTNAELARYNDHLKSELDKALSAKATFSQDVTRYAGEAERLLIQLEQTYRTSSANRARAAALEAEARAGQEEAAVLRAEIERQQGVQAAQAAALDAEKRSLADDLAGMRANLDEVAAQRVEFERQRDAQAGQIEALDAEKRALANEIAEARVTLEEAAALRTAAERLRGEQAARIEALEAETHTLMSELADARAGLEEAAVLRADLDRLRGEHVARVKSLEGEKHALAAEVAEARAGLKEASALRADLERLRDRHAGQIEALNTEQRTLAGEIAEARARLEDEAARAAELERLRTAQGAQIQALEAERTALTGRLLVAQAEVEDARDLAQRNASLMRELDAAEKEASSRTAAIIGQSSELRRARDLVEQGSQHHKEELARSLAGLQHKLDRERIVKLHFAKQYRVQAETKTWNGKRPMRQFLSGLTDRRRTLVAQSKLFDAAFYQLQYPDVVAAGRDPFEHFLEYGLTEGRNPNALFDTQWYYDNYSDVIEGGVTAFEHYLTTGFALGLSPHPLFDAEWYGRTYPDVKEARANPLLHYLESGAAEGRDPNQFFSTSWYAAQYPEVGLSNQNPLVHFVLIGEQAGYNPGPFFDAAWYRRQLNGGHDRADLRPMTHFMTEGRRNGQSPHPYFDNHWYASAYPDVQLSKQSAAEHYLSTGEREGRQPNPFFDPNWYIGQYSDIRERGISPIYHMATAGDAEGREAGAQFSGRAYFDANPDLAVGQIGALKHYLSTGRQEGRPLVRPTPVPQRWLPVPIVHGQPRVLILDATYPTPDRDSGSVDAVNFVRIFQRLGYAVYFIATANFDRSSLDPVFENARHLLEALDVHVLDDTHGESINEVIRLNGGYFDLFFLSRIYCGGEFFEQIRAHTRDPKIIFNTVDIHSLRELREAQITQNREGMFHSYRVAEREYYLARICDATIVVSDEEARLLRDRAPGGNIFTVPLIRDIPGRGNSFEDRSGIGFIGGYRHTPNVDAVCYFLDEIWPHIRAALPDVTFHLMGADMPASLASRTDPGLVIVGHVDDLAEAFDGLRLTVAPLRYGAGAKGKVVTSLSHGVPCIVTPVAAEGMGVGESRSVLIASDPQDFASQVVRAYTSEELWTRLSENGLDLMKDQYSFNAGLNNVRKILSSVASIGQNI